MLLQNDFVYDDIVFDEPAPPKRLTNVRPELVYHIHRAYSSFEGALAAVGIFRLGFGYPPGKFVPHERNFTPLSTSNYMYKHQVVREWRLPNMGAELISNSVLSNMAFDSGRSSLHFGQTQTSHVCQGVRGKIDGVEVIQFALVTDDYTQAFLWDHNCIRVLEAGVDSCAHLEYKDSIYYALSGTPAPSLNAQEHVWVSPTKEGFDYAATSDGVVLNANGLEFKVKKDYAVTLVHANGMFLDKAGIRYSVDINGVECADGECVEAVFESPAEYNQKRARLIRPRPDKTVADTNFSIERTLKAPTLRDVVRRAPLSYDLPRPVTIGYVVPQPFVSYNDYLAAVHLVPGVGPSVWGDLPAPKVSETDSADGIVRQMVRSGVEVISPVSIQDECIRRQVYLVGQSVRSVKYEPVPVFWECDDKLLTTVAPVGVPFEGRVYVQGEDPRIDSHFSEAYVSAGKKKIVTVYECPLGSVPSAPYDPPLDEAKLDASLARQPSPTNVLVRRIGCTRNQLLNHLLSKPDKYSRSDGVFAAWQLKS